MADLHKFDAKAWHGYPQLEISPVVVHEAGLVPGMIVMRHSLIPVYLGRITTVTGGCQLMLDTAVELQGVASQTIKVSFWAPVYSG